MATMEATVFSAPHQGRRHLQRLIRKVKHVLVVKRCIDDLKSSAALRQSRVVATQKSNEILNGLSSGPPAITGLCKLEHGGKSFNCREGSPKVQCPDDDSWSKSIEDRLHEILPRTGGLKSLETHLDRYIARTYENLGRCKESIVNISRDFWIKWARKRGTSIHDTRSQAILVKLLDKEDEGAEQLYNLQRYLEAYIAGSFGRPLETLSEVVSRLRAVFGIGWFFEWPSGRHPLNSTWPWADVKPSLLVLWGVCWMFYPTEYGGPYSPGHFQDPFQSYQYSNLISVPYPSLPTQQGPPPGPIAFTNVGHNQTLVPGGYLATQQPRAPPARQTHSMMQGTTMPWADLSRITGESSAGAAWGQNRLEAEHMTSIKSPFAASKVEGTSHSVGSTGTGAATSTRSCRFQPQWPLQRGGVPSNSNQIFSASGRDSRRFTRNVAEHLWLSPNQPLREPYALGENPAHNKAATVPSYNPRTTHHPLPQYTSASSTSASMPSAAAFSSYPPLDNISEMHDPRAPYMVEQERAYNPMSDPHAYDHHHDPQQDQPRYPTPPPPLSENPYNAQQAAGETPDSRMEMPMEQKSESDAPSPGRSKPVPKPDREVTKDANGRFYCTWAGCTEEVKDFGRKCEWSKHMDKHDRPYKCPADGCEKLPGFTYSGGLLRHEREVHGKHGGPRKQLNCPHPNCKRHTGKGFSRQENLNEHLRRVHTDTGINLNGEETEDDANEIQQGVKRKRTRGDSADLREEMKRLKQENEELRRQAEAQTVQSAEMMRQIMQLQQTQQLQASMQHPRMQAPPAQMT